MEVVDLKESQLIWAPCGAADVYRQGMLVSDNAATALGAPSFGVINPVDSDGVLDTTDDKVFCGIITGNNNRTKVNDATYGGSNITSVTSQADQTARTVHRADGRWGLDPQAMVQLALIDSSTKIKANIFVTTWGTAPTLLTCSAVTDADNNFTANTAGFTSVANMCTVYCRTGANAGIYRMTTDVTANTTGVCQVSPDWPYDVAVGDTFVRVPLRPFGLSHIQFDTEMTFLDGATSPAIDGTDLFAIRVLELNLAVAGKEYAVFTINPIHFLPVH